MQTIHPLWNPYTTYNVQQQRPCVETSYNKHLCQKPQPLLLGKEKKYSKNDLQAYFGSYMDLPQVKHRLREGQVLC